MRYGNKHRNNGPLFIETILRQWNTTDFLHETYTTRIFHSSKQKYSSNFKQLHT